MCAIGALEVDHRENEKSATEDQGANAPRVLLADDDDRNRNREARMLRRLGCCVSVVRNGGEVLRAVEKRPFDVIVMDCRLMGLDGFQTSREIRRMKGDAEDPPIIAISPSAMRDIQRRCLEAGMQERIRKPVRLREISATLQRWLPPDVARGLRSPSRMRDSNAANRATDSDSGDAVSRRLEELFSTLHDRAFLGKQLRHLAQTTRRRWEAIDDAFQSGDLSAVRQHTASLRDLLEPLRAKDVLESCAQIKAAAEGGDLQALSHLAEDLKRQTGELIDLLERHCRRTATRRKAPPPTAAV